MYRSVHAREVAARRGMGSITPEVSFPACGILGGRCRRRTWRWYGGHSRRSIAAMSRRTWKWPRRRSNSFPASPLEGQGPITGHEGIRDYFHGLWSYSEASQFQVEEMRAVEERVLAFFVITATSSRASRPPSGSPASTTSNTGRSAAPMSSPTAPKPSKRWVSPR